MSWLGCTLTLPYTLLLIDCFPHQYTLCENMPFLFTLLLLFFEREIVRNKRDISHWLPNLVLFYLLCWLMIFNLCIVVKRLLLSSGLWWIIIADFRSLCLRPLFHGRSLIMFINWFTISLFGVSDDVFLLLSNGTAFLSLEAGVLASVCGRLTHWVNFSHLDHWRFHLDGLHVVLQVWLIIDLLNINPIIASSASSVLSVHDERAFARSGFATRRHAHCCA